MSDYDDRAEKGACFDAEMPLRYWHLVTARHVIFDMSFWMIFEEEAEAALESRETTNGIACQMSHVLSCRG